jgi:hypothetical protein
MMLSGKNDLTGVAGFEPANGGVKVHSLTTWRHPKFVTQLQESKIYLYIYYLYKLNILVIGQEGIRTPDTVVRSHVL